MISLVTGGAGFIGSHVVRHCLSMGHSVVVLDDLSGGRIDNIPQEAEFIQGSIYDHTLLANLFSNYSFDYVYHLGAYAAEGLSHFIRRFNYNNNLVGSINLINESVKHNIKCFVFTSSIAVYGSNQTPMNEEMIPMPEDPYGISKYAVELDLQAANKLFGLNYIIFRPHNVYGEHQNIGDRYRNVIGIFMNQILSKKPMTIFGDGLQKRAFSYIDDVAPHIARSVCIQKAYNEIFNIGADTPYSINYLAELVARSLGVEPVITHLPSRNEVINAFSDHQKVKNILGVEPKTDLIEGITQMSNWVKRIGICKSKSFEEIEIEKNMPPSWLTS